MQNIENPVGSVMGLVFFGVFCVWIACLISVISFQVFRRSVVWFVSLVTLLFVFCSLFLLLLLITTPMSRGVSIDPIFAFVMTSTVAFITYTVWQYFYAAKSYESRYRWLLFVLFSLLLLLPSTIYQILIVFVGADPIPVGIATGEMYHVDNTNLRLLVILVLTILIFTFTKIKVNALIIRIAKLNLFSQYFINVIVFVFLITIIGFVVYFLLPENWFYSYRIYSPPDRDAIYGF